MLRCMIASHSVAVDGFETDFSLSRYFGFMTIAAMFIP